MFQKIGHRFGSCIPVDQSCETIRKTFWKLVDVLEPGFRCLPCDFNPLHRMDLNCQMYTKDNMFIDVVVSVRYRDLAKDKDQDNATYRRITEIERVIQFLVSDVIRDNVPKLELDLVFKLKKEIANAVKDELEKVLFRYGFEMVRTLIVDVDGMDETSALRVWEIKRDEVQRIAAASTPGSIAGNNMPFIWF